MGKNRRASVAQRRGSVLNAAAPKLAKRIELQKIFNNLLPEGETRVDRRALMINILKNQELIGIFTQEQTNELSYQGAETTIDWPTFLDFIQKCENPQQNHSMVTENSQSENGRNDGPAFSEAMPEFVVFGELVDRQSKALEVDIDGDNIKISMMDTDDIRVAMSGSNKLIVDSMVDAIDLVTDYATQRQIQESNVPVLLDYVERAIIKACQQELHMLEQMAVECVQQMEQMAAMLLDMELKMMVSIDDCKRAQFMSGVHTMSSGGGARRGSVQQDVRMAMKAEGSGVDERGKVVEEVPTPGALARKLSQLQQRVAKKEEELGHYQKVAFRRRASQASLLTVGFNQSADEDKGRLEWRKEVDSRLSIIKVTNMERAALIRDNNTLRTTVECGRTAGMSGKLRKRIASERADRVTHISSLQTEIAQLEAELRIALEEGKTSSGESVSEEGGSSDPDESEAEALSRRLGGSSRGGLSLTASSGGTRH